MPLSSVFLHISIDVASLVTFADCPPLVVLPLASGQGQLYFGQTPLVKIDLKRHKRKAPLFELDPDSANLGPVQEQLSLSGRLMLAAPRLLVRGDLRADEPALPVVYPCVRAGQIGGAGS
jgi:hypothetical protein